jgi:hypothetical protein
MNRADRLSLSHNTTSPSKEGGGGIDLPPTTLPCVTLCSFENESRGALWCRRR